MWTRKDFSRVAYLSPFKAGTIAYRPVELPSLRATFLLCGNNTHWTSSDFIETRSTHKGASLFLSSRCKSALFLGEDTRVPRHGKTINFLWNTTPFNRWATEGVPFFSFLRLWEDIIYRIVCCFFWIVEKNFFLSLLTFVVRRIENFSFNSMIDISNETICETKQKEGRKMFRNLI